MSGSGLPIHHCDFRCRYGIRTSDTPRAVKAADHVRMTAGEAKP